MYDGGVQVTGNTYGYASDGGANDGLGQMTSLATYGGSTTTFSYDAAGQLTGSQNSVYGNLTYSYDAAGNSDAAGTTIGTDNQISTDGVWNYYYDAVGNRTMKINVADCDAWVYTYNDANQMTSAKHYSSSSGGVPTPGTMVLEEDFTYDVFGNRLSDTLMQSGSTTVTRFAYDQNGDAWADLDASNQLVTRRIYMQGVDQLFARIDAATGHAYFDITDANNSVDAVIDANTGNVVDAITYDAYGNILNQTGPAFGDRYGFDGREFDSALDLYYDRARYYDPQTRTFTSPDPAQADPLGNTYRYVENDPMDRTDPSGMSEQDVFVLQSEQSGYSISSMPALLYNSKLELWNSHIMNDELELSAGAIAAAYRVYWQNGRTDAEISNDLRAYQYKVQQLKSNRLVGVPGTVGEIDLNSLQFKDWHLEDTLNKRRTELGSQSTMAICHAQLPSYRHVRRPDAATDPGTVSRDRKGAAGFQWKMQIPGSSPMAWPVQLLSISKALARNPERPRTIAS